MLFIKNSDFINCLKYIEDWIIPPKIRKIKLTTPEKPPVRDKAFVKVNLFLS